MFKLNNLIYIGSLTIYLLLVFLTLFYVSSFFAERVNNAFLLDTERINLSVNRLDFEKFKQIAPRLGINTTNL